MTRNVVGPPISFINENMIVPTKYAASQHVIDDALSISEFSSLKSHHISQMLSSPNRQHQKYTSWESDF